MAHVVETETPAAAQKARYLADYRRVRAEVELRDGDEFFMGEQLFHVEVKTPE